MKDGILIGLIIALLVVLGIGWYQYSKLEDKFQEIQIKQNENQYIIDSLKNINDQNNYIIDSLSLTVSNLEKDAIPLKKDKQEIESQTDSLKKVNLEGESQLDKFKSKDNIEDNIILLRENRWKHSH